MTPSRPPTDLRKQRTQMNRRLLLLVLFVLVVVGGLLIGVIYGMQAGALAVLCLAAGAGVIALLWFIFTLLGKWAGE